jgi:hypothetical protein
LFLLLPNQQPLGNSIALASSRVRILRAVSISQLR